MIICSATSPQKTNAPSSLKFSLCGSMPVKWSSPARCSTTRSGARRNPGAALQPGNCADGSQCNGVCR